MDATEEPDAPSHLPVDHRRRRPRVRPSGASADGDTAGGVSGDVPGPAQRHDRDALAQGGRLHDRGPEPVRAELRDGVVAAHALPRGLRRGPARLVGLRRGHRRLRGLRRARVPRSPSPAAAAVAAAAVCPHLPGPARRQHRGAEAARRAVHDHRQGPELRVGLAALHALPPGLRRRPAAPVARQQPDRPLHAEPHGRVPASSRRRARAAAGRGTSRTAGAAAARRSASTPRRRSPGCGSAPARTGCTSCAARATARSRPSGGSSSWGGCPRSGRSTSRPRSSTATARGGSTSSASSASRRDHQLVDVEHGVRAREHVEGSLEPENVPRPR